MSAPVDWEPLMALPPDQGPDAVHAVAMRARSKDTVLSRARSKDAKALIGVAPDAATGGRSGPAAFATDAYIDALYSVAVFAGSENRDAWPCGIV